MMEPIVSIIIPVYNTEKYLPEALDSVLAQTVTDIEVLCVDDGSTDSTLDILREYAAKDPRLTVYSQQHQFAGAARNLGMSHAQGKYMLFLDADDIFDPRLGEKAYTRAEETTADVCVFSAEAYDENSGERRPMPHLCRVDLCPKEVFSADDCPNEFFHLTTPAPWNKLFRREFIREQAIEFQRTRSCNDKAFVLTALVCAKRITMLNEPLLLYRISNTGSLQHTQDKAPLSFYDALRELRSRLTARGRYDFIKDEFAAMTANNCIANLSTMKTAAGFLTVYNTLRNTAVPEFGLDALPEWTDRVYSSIKLRERFLDIRQLRPEAYIAKFGPGLRDVIKFGDTGFIARVVLERLKRIVKH